MDKNTGDAAADAVGAKDRALGELLDGLDHAAGKDTVSVQDTLNEFGDRAITPFILLVAIIMVSPLSGIPSAPTFAAVLIVVMSVQALSGRRRLWLPKWLLRRNVQGSRLQKAVSWLRKPCAFLDRHSHERLKFLTYGPMRWFTLLLCVLIPLGWPPLELLPFVTSFGAGTIALLVYGLFTRDGVYVLLGYAMVLVTAFTVWSLWV